MDINKLNELTNKAAPLLDSGLNDPALKVQGFG
jgi:hypothetical protein